MLCLYPLSNLKVKAWLKVLRFSRAKRFQGLSAGLAISGGGVTCQQHDRSGGRRLRDADWTVDTTWAGLFYLRRQEATPCVDVRTSNGPDALRQLSEKIIITTANLNHSDMIIVEFITSCP